MASLSTNARALYRAGKKEYTSQSLPGAGPVTTADCKIDR